MARLEETWDPAPETLNPKPKPLLSLSRSLSLSLSLSLFLSLYLSPQEKSCLNTRVAVLEALVSGGRRGGADVGCRVQGVGCEVLGADKPLDLAEQARWRG